MDSNLTPIKKSATGIATRKQTQPETRLEEELSSTMQHGPHDSRNTSIVPESCNLSTAIPSSGVPPDQRPTHRETPDLRHHLPTGPTRHRWSMPVFPMLDRQVQCSNGSGPSETFARDTESEDLLRSAYPLYDSQGEVEMSQGRRDISRAIIQPRRPKTNRKAQGAPIPTGSPSSRFNELFRLHHSECNDIPETRKRPISLPENRRRSNWQYSHCNLSPLGASYGDTGMRIDDQSRASVMSQDFMSRLPALDRKRSQDFQSNGIAEPFALQMMGRNLELETVSRHAVGLRSDQKMIKGNQEGRDSQLNRHQTPERSLDHEKNVDRRPRLRVQRRRNVQAQNPYTTESDEAHNMADKTSRRTMEMAELQGHGESCLSPPRSPYVSGGNLHSSTPEVSSSPVDVENDFANENRNILRECSQLEDILEIENIGILRQKPIQKQDPIEAIQANSTARGGGLLEHGVFDEVMTLSTGNDEIPSPDNRRTNPSDTEPAAFREANGTLETLNELNALRSNEMRSTMILDMTDPLATMSTQEFPQTPMKEQNEGKTANHTQREMDKNILGFRVLHDPGATDVLDSSIPDKANVGDLPQRSIRLEGEKVGGNHLTLRAPNMESTNVEAGGDAQCFRNDASQCQTEQTAWESQQTPQEVDICDAEDAFYNYDWTKLTFIERRKRRMQILKAKRLSPSKTRVKKTATSFDQVISFGKLPEKVIIELSAAYPRQRPSQKKTRRVRNREMAQKIRNQTKKQLEFHQKENEKLLLKLSSSKSQSAALTRQLEQGQNRLREVQAEAALLRVDNTRLRTKMNDLQTFHDRLLLSDEHIRGRAVNS